jgi:hypothetical protein
VSEPPDSATFESASATAEVSIDSGTSAQLAARVDERPELAVGAAFAGGVLLALILKRLAR